MCVWGAGDVMLLGMTKELVHSALLSPTAAGAVANGQALDQQADDEFGEEVSAAIVDWIAKRMSDYHKNFHDTQLMQVSQRLLGVPASGNGQLQQFCLWAVQDWAVLNTLMFQPDCPKLFGNL